MRGDWIDVSKVAVEKGPVCHRLLTAFVVHRGCSEYQYSLVVCPTLDEEARFGRRSTRGILSKVLPVMRQPAQVDSRILDPFEQVSDTTS